MSKWAEANRTPGRYDGLRKKSVWDREVIVTFPNGKSSWPFKNLDSVRKKLGLTRKEVLWLKENPYNEFGYRLRWATRKSMFDKIDWNCWEEKPKTKTEERNERRRNNTKRLLGNSRSGTRKG